MHEKVVTIANEIGLHARPASRFVDIAKKFKSEISAGKDENFVDAKSMLMLLTLQAKKGDKVVIRAVGEDEENAVDKLAEFVTDLKD